MSTYLKSQVCFFFFTNRPSLLGRREGYFLSTSKTSLGVPEASGKDTVCSMWSICKKLNFEENVQDRIFSGSFQNI